MNEMPRLASLIVILALCSGCAHKKPAVAPLDKELPPPTLEGVAGMTGMGSESANGVMGGIMGGVTEPREQVGAGNQPRKHDRGYITSHRYAHKQTQVVGITGSSLQSRVERWFQQLLHGSIQYHVPTTMYWREGATISVVIIGPQAPRSSGLPNPTGTGTLRISDRMKVDITAPDNPDEFTIVQEGGGSDIRFVPDNGSTTWNWIVTPKYTGRDERLRISAYVLYPGQGDKILERLPVYAADVRIKVPGIEDCIKRLLEGDPEYWLRYGLPGGAGFAFVAGIVAYIRKRKSETTANRSRRKKAHV